MSEFIGLYFKDYSAQDTESLLTFSYFPVVFSLSVVSSCTRSCSSVPDSDALSSPHYRLAV